MEYAGGIAAGVVSSVSIAPIMMILDTAIIRSQFQGSTLGQGKREASFYEIYTSRA